MSGEVAVDELLVGACREEATAFCVDDVEPAGMGGHRTRVGVERGIEHRATAGDATVGEREEPARDQSVTRGAGFR